jgi:hypothetical protein
MQGRISTMIIHRDIGSSYHHKPTVQEVDYSPFMVESKEESCVEEERWPEVIPAEVPHPIFIGAASVSWFRISLLPPHKNASGGSLYRGFRSILSI